MHIKLAWDNQSHTCILWRYEPGWTWVEFRATVLHAQKMVRSVSHPVDVIFDTAFTSTPVDGTLFSEFNSAINRIPPNLGLLVVCNITPFASSITRIYARIIAGTGIQLHTAPNVNAARQLIQDIHNVKPAIR